MTDDVVPDSSMVLYQTEDGRTRIQCRFESETIWLNEHLINVFDEGEISREATIRKFRIVRFEGAREVAREVEHYSLPAILAVGYRVRSKRGTQFRQWATEPGEYSSETSPFGGRGKNYPHGTATSLETSARH